MPSLLNVKFPFVHFGIHSVPLIYLSIPVLVGFLGIQY